MKETEVTDQILAQTVVLLQALRVEQGLNPGQLAQRAGLTRPAISYIETGQRKPSLLVCLKIARAMGVSLAKVLGEAERRVHEGKG